MDKLRELGELFNSIKQIDNEIDNYKLQVQNLGSSFSQFNYKLSIRGQLSFRDQKLLVQLMNTQNEISGKLIDSLNNKKVFESRIKELTIELLTKDK